MVEAHQLPDARVVACCYQVEGVAPFDPIGADGRFSAVVPVSGYQQNLPHPEEVWVPYTVQLDQIIDGDVELRGYGGQRVSKVDDVFLPCGRFGCAARNDQTLTGVDEVRVPKVVCPDESGYRDPVLRGNAAQRLPPPDHVYGSGKCVGSRSTGWHTRDR